MKYKIAGICAYFISTLIPASWSRGEEALPPIGERKYVLDHESPFAPTQIKQQQHATGGTYLKDPRFPASVPKRIPRQVVKKVAKRPSAPAYIPQKIQFKKVAIRGYLREPRVKFDREILQVNRADEPTSRDFLDKVFEVGQDL